MAEIDEEFNLRDWEWIAVHFPPSERQSMAKVAWLICCKCTPEEISQYNPAPRIVIPLCVIVLLDEIDLSQLKSLKNSRENAIEYYISSLMFDHISRSRQNQEDINRLINSMNPSRKWKSLFKTLDIGLQLSLVYRLLTFRPPTRDDWRNIFPKKSEITSFLLETNLSFQSGPAKSLILYFFIFSGILLWMFFLYLLFDFSWKMNLLIEIFILGIILVVCSIFLRAIIVYLRSPTITNLILYFLIFSGVLLWMIVLFHFFWKTTLLVKIIILVTCFILWIYGQNIYRKVTNPLKDIFKSDIS